MCALQNHSVHHERHRSSINTISSLHLALEPQKQCEMDVKSFKVEILFLPRTLFGYMFCPIFYRGDEAVCQRMLQPDTDPFTCFQNLSK